MIFPLCNISNNPAFTVDQDSCFTEELPSAVKDIISMDIRFHQPIAQNNYQLSIDTNSDITSAGLYNLQGQIMEHTTSKHIDCSNLSSAVYIVSVEAGGKKVGKKIFLSR